MLCTVALARKCAPLVRQRKLALLADALGIQVDVVHRALPDAFTCARILCALFPRLCAAAPTVADAVAALTSARRRGRGNPPSRAAAAAREPPGPAPPAQGPRRVRVPRRARAPAVRGQVGVAAHTRAGPLLRPGGLDRAGRGGRLPRHELGAGRAGAGEPADQAVASPGNKALKRTDKWAYVLCRLDVEYPVLEVSAEPASGRAVSIGPVRGKKLAAELADHLTSLYRLRHCGRRMSRRENPSIYGQMGRCCSPCLGDLDPNAYRGQVDKVLALFEHEHGAAEPLLAEIDERMAAASRERRYERAAALLRRRERLEALLGRLDGVLRAVHADPRLVLARHPVQPRFDALWLVNGRVADWGPLPEQPTRWRGGAGGAGGRRASRAHVGPRRGRGRGADRLGVDGRAPPARAGADRGGRSRAGRAIRARSGTSRG